MVSSLRLGLEISRAGLDLSVGMRTASAVLQPVTLPACNCKMVVAQSCPCMSADVGALGQTDADQANAAVIQAAAANMAMAAAAAAAQGLGIEAAARKRERGERTLPRLPQRASRLANISCCLRMEPGLYLRVDA
jgi:hypothetical protein